jgi:hypothetical protein
MGYTVLEKKMYEEARYAISVAGELVEVIGEQKMEVEDDRVIEQYIYNIVGYTPKNGKPFVALKANIFLN